MLSFVYGSYTQTGCFILRCLVLFCVREMSCQLCWNGSSSCSGIQLHSKHLSWWFWSTSCFPLSSSVRNGLRLHASSVISFSTDMKTEQTWTEEACSKCCSDMLWLHIIWNAFFYGWLDLLLTLCNSSSRGFFILLRNRNQSDWFIAEYDQDWTMWNQSWYNYAEYGNNLYFHL